MRPPARNPALHCCDRRYVVALPACIPWEHLFPNLCKAGGTPSKSKDSPKKPVKREE